MAGKLLGNSGFANTPCTPDKKCSCPVLILFPTQHLLIDLAPKYSFYHRFFILFGAKIAIKSQIPKEKKKNAEILKGLLLKSAENLKGIRLIYAENLNIH